MNKYFKLFAAGVLAAGLVQVPAVGVIGGAAFGTSEVYAASEGKIGSNATYTLDDNGVMTISGSGILSGGPILKGPDSLKLKKVVFAEDSSITEIGGGNFVNAANLETVQLPASVTKIGASAFANCSSLLFIDLNKVNTLGSEAFASCTTLQMASIPATVTTVGEKAFCNCTKLSSVTFAEGVVMIGTSAFEGCSALKSVELPTTLSRINSSAFKNCKLQSIVFPKNVIYIDSEAFSGAFDGDAVKVEFDSDSAIYFGEKAFGTLDNTVSVAIPEGSVCGGNSGMEKILENLSDGKYSKVFGNANVVVKEKAVSVSAEDVLKYLCGVGELDSAQRSAARVTDDDNLDILDVIALLGK